jgi:hypothetical protein
VECYSSRFLRCCEAARLISRGLLALCALALLPIASSTTVMAKDKFVALGTGSPNGTYFPVGRGICELINDSRLEHGVRCIAYNTGGSVSLASVKPCSSASRNTARTLWVFSWNAA